MTLAHIPTIQSCHCEEWNDEAISVGQSEIASGLALAMTVFESFRAIKHLTLLVRMPTDRSGRTLFEQTLHIGNVGITVTRQSTRLNTVPVSTSW